MMKKLCLLFSFLFLITGCAFADASETDACEHQWGACSTADFDFCELEQVFEVVNEQRHNELRYYPEEQCALCGATRGRGFGAGSLVVHNFDLVKWEYLNQEQEVAIFLRCRTCNYDRVIVSDVQPILDGTSESCLLGGACPINLYGVMYPEGIAMIDGSRSFSDQITFSGVIEMPCTEETSHFFVANRVYCPICGRPRREDVKTSYGGLPESWAESPLYTEEEFFTVDMPDNLPYQLVDQLRAGKMQE